jgi:hypothetical protein
VFRASPIPSTCSFTGGRSRTKRPYVSWLVRTDETQCTVVFEPVGSEYVLTADDEVLIHLFRPSDRDENQDVEIVSQPGRIQFWTAGDDYRAWNKAGDELSV